MSTAGEIEAQGGQVAKRFMVGRQPVFDEKLDVFGYELLFRDPGIGPVVGDVMTADVILRAGLDIGLGGLVGSGRAFVNATRPYLVGEREIPLPADQTVIEVLESVAHDAEVIAGCKRLVAEGYLLALDDYVWVEGDESLLELASIVKLDIIALSPMDLETHVERCSGTEARLLAEKVETMDQLELCQQLGFDLFQGYLLSRPVTVEGKSLDPSRLTCLRLIERLSDPDISARDIATIVEEDPGLSHRFLRAAATGAAQGMRKQLSSIREGVVLMGERRMRSWIILMLLSDLELTSVEHLRIAVTRARMCELVSTEIAVSRPDSVFTVGLVSALDVLLNTPLSNVVDNLSLTDELHAALIDHTGAWGASSPTFSAGRPAVQIWSPARA